MLFKIELFEVPLFKVFKVTVDICAAKDVAETILLGSEEALECLLEFPLGILTTGSGRTGLGCCESPDLVFPTRRDVAETILLGREALDGLLEFALGILATGRTVLGCCEEEAAVLGCCEEEAEAEEDFFLLLSLVLW